MRINSRGEQYFNQVSHGVVKTPFSRWLDTNGDGSGTKEAIGDYSAAPQSFSITPSQVTDAEEVMRVARMIVSIEDSGAFSAEKYGYMSALTNGVRLVVTRDSVEIDDGMNGVPVTSNAEWGALCYDASVKTWGVGNQMLLVRWTFEKTGSIIRLDGEAKESLDIVLNDDFSGLIKHRFLVQGYYE